MKKLLLNVFLLTFLFSIHLAAQNTADYEKYIEEAGNRSLIFRGKFDIRYNFKHEGTPYAYSSDFVKGFVRFNGKDYYDVLINLNSNTDDVCIKKDAILIDAVALEKTLVDYFIIDSRKFVNIKEGNGLMLPGYYEVLYDDNKEIHLYKKIYQIYREDIDRQNGNLIVKLFEPQVRYFLVKGDSVFPVKNKRSLISPFKDRKSVIQRELSSKKIEPSSRYTKNEVIFQTILKSLEK